MEKSFDDLMSQMVSEGFRLSHLGLSGQRWYAVVYRGFNPLVNVGRGLAWGNLPSEAVMKAWEERRGNQGSGKGVKLPANMEDLLR